MLTLAAYYGAALVVATALGIAISIVMLAAITVLDVRRRYAVWRDWPRARVV